MHGAKVSADLKRMTKAQKIVLAVAITTMILFLVVAILLFVGVALLSSLNAGTKPVNKTPIRTAMTAVKSVQTGLDLTDFSGITIEDVRDAEPDLNWQDFPLGAQADVNSIQFEAIDDENIRLASRSEDDYCYYLNLDSSVGTLYGSGKPNKDDLCDAKTALIDKDNMADGWRR